MRVPTLVGLVVLAVLAVAGGWYLAAPSEAPPPAAGLMFPNLAPKLQNAAKVEITHQGKTLVIEKRQDGLWGVASMHDYPVQESKLRGMLTALTELRLSEPRTSDPKEYPRLGVDDPNGADSTADLLRVLDAKGGVILSVIVGHRKVRSQGGEPDEVYVRRPNEAQSWLALGNLTVDADPSLWLDRDVMNIGHERIASMVVGANALVFGRTNGKFGVTQPAEHPKLESYKVDDVARALELLTFEEVEPDKESSGQEAGHSVFETNDGLAVRVTVLHAGQDVWARFVVSGKNTAEADRMNTRLGGWTYKIGSWKEKSLVPTLEDLEAPPPKPAVAAAPAAK